MRRFILIVAIAVVAATIGTIYVGSRTFDGVVEDRPYETGLAWDAIEKEQARLGWHVAVEQPALRQGYNEVVLRLTDRKGAPLSDATIDVTLSRPSTRKYDSSSTARPLGGGRYRVSIDVPLIGAWDLRVAVGRQTDRFRAVERVEAAERVPR